jgi:tetratricopeptide (TPR) repeat protein
VTHVLLAAAIATAALLGVDAPPGRILVMPFENVAREGQMVWLTEASAVLLADDLNALGANAFTRDERREALDRLQVPQAATLTDATVIRIGQLVGASDVIVGSLQVENGALVVRARSIALESGRVTIDLTEHGELFGAFERIARRIAPTLNMNTSATGEPRHPPLAVFENYIKGLMAQTPPTAVRYLEAALAAQPGYDPAKLALWDVYSEQGEHARALAAVESVRADSVWSRRSRFLAGLSQIELRKYDDAFESFTTLAGRTGGSAPALSTTSPPAPSASPTALNNLGVVQLRRGWTPQTGRPTYYFTQAAEADPSEPDYCFNLGYAYWEERDAAAALYWLREAVRRNPADGEAHFVLGAALALSGNAPEAVREKELAKRLSSTFEQWDRRPAADVVPKGLERVKRDVGLPRTRRLEVTLAGNERRDQQELARFYLDRGRRLFDQENDREAIAELDRALYLSPYLAEAHLLAGRLHLRNGRAREAVDALKISIWSTETAEAHIAPKPNGRSSLSQPPPRPGACSSKPTPSCLTILAGRACTAARSVLKSRRFGLTGTRRRLP